MKKIYYDINKDITMEEKTSSDNNNYTNPCGERFITNEDYDLFDVCEKDNLCPDCKTTHNKDCQELEFVKPKGCGAWIATDENDMDVFCGDLDLLCDDCKKESSK